MPAIEVSCLSKDFRCGREKKRVLDGLSFSVEAGETFGILGPNGAGKTTLLRILCGLILQDEGTVLVERINVAKHPEKAKRKIGFLRGNERSFYGRLSGRRNLEFFACLYGLSSHMAHQKIEELALRLDLQGKMDQPCQVYSTGQLQKLAIARALLHAPSILFVDELSTHLDYGSTFKIHDLFKELAIGKTVLLATNNLDEAERLCDRVLILHEGKASAYGPLSEILARAQSQDLKGSFLKLISSDSFSPCVS